MAPSPGGLGRAPLAVVAAQRVTQPVTQPVTQAVTEADPEAGPGIPIETLLAAQARLRACPDVPGLLAALLDLARELLDAPAAVALVEDDVLVRRAAAGDPRWPLGVEVPLADTVCGRALTARVPVRVADTSLSAPGAPAPTCCPPAASMAAVPMVLGSRPLGVLALSHREPGRLGDADVRLAALLAGTAGVRLARLLPPGGRAADPQPPAGDAAQHPPEPAVEPAPAPIVRPSAGTPARGVVSYDVLAVVAAEHPPPVPAAPRPPVPGVAAARPWPRLEPVDPAGPVVPFGVWTVDPASHVHVSGPVAALVDALDPIERAHLHARLLQHALEGDGSTTELRVGDGRVLHAWCEPSTSGRVLHGVVADVTSARDATVGVRTARAGLRAAQELTGLAVWAWDPVSGSMDWSPEMFGLLGLEPGDEPPSLAAWHHHVDARDLPRVRTLDVDLVAGTPAADAPEQPAGQVQTFTLIGRDGTRRTVQAWSALVRDEASGRLVVHGAALDVTRQVRDRVLVERVSATDPVTGLGNRVAVDRRLSELLRDPDVLADRARHVSLILLDLDRFKLVNDSLGHAVGDLLLVQVAKRLVDVVPPEALIARMGGDEFVVVPAPGMTLTQLRRLADVVVDRLRTPYLIDGTGDGPAAGGQTMVCPASLGVTTSGGRVVSAQELLSEADLALYRAKDSGRDRYVVFDDALRRRAHRRHQAELDLRAALEDDRLVLEYQPIVDFAHGRLVGAEALVRMRADDGTLLSPDSFIEVAEDCGLVVDLDCWVIEKSLAQSQAWAAQVARSGGVVPFVSINVSPRSMEHPRVVRRLTDAVGEGRVRPEHLKVELTEHSFLAALPAAHASLRDLLGSGVPVGIDDFGTGYSALAYLQRFELDFMKIDRSFVADVGRLPRADAVVTAIVDLAHAHGMRVIAEGVETPRQARRLREFGCDLAQGWHFGRPGEAPRILRAGAGLGPRVLRTGDFGSAASG